MSPKLILGAVFVSVFIFAGWQTQQNGKLKAVNNQYEAAIGDMRKAILERHERYKQTDSMLASSRRQYQQTELKAQELADDLRTQNDACLNAVIPDAVIDRVLEFQTGSD